MWVTRNVPAPAAHVWRVLIDTTTWSHWGPSVTGVEHDGRFLGPGSRGRIRTVVGPWLDFEITRFEEGKLWAWRVAGIATTTHHVRSLGASHSQAGIELPLLAAPYSVVCALALARIDRLACDRPHLAPADRRR